MNDAQERDAHGDGQQGTGGVAGGQATSTSNQNGRQPHLGNQPGANSAPSGSGQSGSDRSAGIADVDRIDQAGISGHSGSPAQTSAASSDRLDTIEQADAVHSPTGPGHATSARRPPAIRVPCCPNRWVTAITRSRAARRCRWPAERTVHRKAGREGNDRRRLDSDLRVSLDRIGNGTLAHAGRCRMRYPHVHGPFRAPMVP